jgi:hypothetical protein
VQSAQMDVPPGTIEGIVLRGKRPVSGGLVHLMRCGFGCRIPLASMPGRERLQSTAIDSGGLFRFTGLPDSAYTLGLDLGADIQHQTTVQVTRTHPGRRTVIVLGEARVIGHVYDERGLPIEGARVTVYRYAAGGSIALDAVTQTSRLTDSSGAYEITDVGVGRHGVGLRVGSAWEDDTVADQYRLVTVPAEGTLVVDFGHPHPCAVWTGTVRARTGEHVTGPSDIWLTAPETEAGVRGSYDEQGRFRMPLTPGHFEVRVHPRFAQSGVDCAGEDIDIGAVDVERDIVLAGARVTGRVVAEEAGRPWSEEQLWVRVRLLGQPVHLARNQASPVDSRHGTFVLDGLSPGKYVLNTDPLPLASGPDTVEFTVSAGDERLDLEVAVRSP